MRFADALVRPDEVLRKDEPLPLLLRVEVFPRRDALALLRAAAPVLCVLEVEVGRLLRREAVLVGILCFITLCGKLAENESASIRVLTY